MYVRTGAGEVATGLQEPGASTPQEVASMVSTDPTSLTTVFIAKLLKRLTQRRDVVTEEVLAERVRAVLEGYRREELPLLFSYSPYASLGELLGDLSSTGIVGIGSGAPGQRRVRLTPFGASFAENGLAAKDLSRRLGFSDEALSEVTAW